MSNSLNIEAISPVYLHGFGGDSQATPNQQVSSTLLFNVRAANGTPTLYETKPVSFFISDWLPRGCEALFGFDHLQETLIGISWDQSTSPLTFQLDLPKVRYPVVFLISQAPEQLSKTDISSVYGPRSEKLPDEYDFRHLDSLAKILNKSPIELQTLKDPLNEARYNPRRPRYINDGTSSANGSVQYASS
ncbi:hypothetical protein SARC_05721 [Sphaeroforma arctica JP610]|uniref:Uncharacterized protein n=1 Tax=Sphaeroforma arctica JP610 TaxID=667725 RepID=A0A0L0FYR8_9EUKA|nr:hypothetical protein SARC_05721 [Sphaeroforma arctica JP610]KNC81992.1 hypothetical protein SARC_05721 [Sphaeroforma arctica JP610]|eukprot:XP_014155894.1 hypothetical protein SARC_05721 [Sphaeroforma arctica JP610]